MKRRTIGESPLDAVIPPAASPRPPAKRKAASPRPRPRKATETEPPPSPSVKERLSVPLPAPLMDRLRDRVYWTPDLTMTALVEDALEKALERLDRERGKAAPRTAPLKVGRPVKRRTPATGRSES